METSDFHLLCSQLSRFRHISPRWAAILVHLFNRCDGYLEQYTLGEMATTPYLLVKTTTLLSTLDAGADDQTLCDLLATEFEGWYFTAVNHDGSHWSSLGEDFETFFQRCPGADLIISNQPHANLGQLQHWLADLCRLEQQP